MFPLPRPLSTLLVPVLGTVAAVAIAAGGSSLSGLAQPAPTSGRVVVRADVQEADAETGTIVARGNVEIDYPARQIRATAAQVQLFQKEQRLVLSGDVLILQEGNSIRAERVVYLIEENRFVATPKSSQQVESVYVIPARTPAAEEDASTPSTTSDSAPPL